MDPTRIVTVVISAVALCASVLMTWRALRRYREGLRLGVKRSVLLRFARRRVTMGVMLGVVAVMLFLGMHVLDGYFRTSPAAFTWFWLAVLALLVWLIFLAIFDLVAVLHSRLEQWQRRPPFGGD